jgi:hypothetical protein
MIMDEISENDKQKDGKIGAEIHYQILFFKDFGAKVIHRKFITILISVAYLLSQVNIE